MVGGAGCDEMSQGKGMGNATAGVWDLEAAPPRQGDARAPGYAVPLGHEVFNSSRYATGVLTVNASGMHWRLIDSIKGA